ncbi:MAG: phosphoglucosamine mutase [Acidobacteria bacterium]|nr:phosphoglucosamine mutase [Acidobacteriota bacterium]MCA1627419.1 phosphoglucosamine mutase [Acidobacteriota bacterium]
MKALFGTDGIRGEAGSFPLDAATVSTIGFSLANHLAETVAEPVIVIGRDTRESGEWLEEALTQGAMGAGAKCLSAGVITTPGVAYLTRKLQAHAGVVISASHNPYQDNGIKIFSPSGEKIDSALERQIESDVYHGSKSSSDLKNVSPLAVASLRNDYLNFLANEIASGLSLKGLTMVVDCANGASTEFAPLLFETLGARVVPINAKPDGRNINLNSGSLHIESVIKTVINEKAHLGVAFDGDADRSLFVDEKGNFVDGDATLWLLAHYLRSHERLKDDTVVATVMSNVGLEVAFRGVGIRLVRTDVGDKYVLDELRRLGASLGGEQSGHIIMPELSLAGDGMITALCLLRALRESDKTLSQATAGFQQYPQILLNVRVREKVPFATLESVQEEVRDVEERLSPTGRLLLRYSGTEPLARVMIEGEKQFEIDEYAQRIADAIKREIGA